MFSISGDNRDGNRQLAMGIAKERIMYGKGAPGRTPRMRKLIALACRDDFDERQRLAQTEHTGQRV
jgi:hypothetical protein